MSRYARRLWLVMAATLCAAALMTGCRGASTSDRDGSTSPSASSRSFMMGFSTIPRELNADAYADTFKLAAQHGEMVLIQRTPPWADFLPGAAVSDDTARTTASEKQAIADRKLHLFFAIDPTDSATARDRLADLPPPLATHRFGDDDVRAAFLSYARYVALNYKPDYVALGVDMNEYYETNKDDFENFRSLYQSAYDAVKAISPETKITTTLQYEDLQGILHETTPHFPEWQLVKSLEPMLDFVAISTYPSLSFPDARSVPDNYYSQLRAFTSKPIAFAQVGYSSAPQNAPAGSGEDDQANFVRRLLADARTLDTPFVIWFAGWDPMFAQDSAQSMFRHIGLLRDDASEKPAWQYWAEMASRPYAPG